MRFVSSKIKEHYANKNKRFKKYTGVRLIGVHALSCTPYTLHIINAIKGESDNDYQKVKLLALSKICQTLRTIGTLINSVTSTSKSIKELKD